MCIDEEYINEEVETLIEMIENGTFDTSKCNNFISTSNNCKYFTQKNSNYVIIK